MNWIFASYMSVIVFVLTLDEIDGVSEIMPQINKEWADRIIFVDGGSTDGTIEKAQELASSKMGALTGGLNLPGLM